ncbi:MAG: efflux RND transporter permease subunit [Myxococcales bacterium]|nr:efflux RND transporter permease subunit [Myxococcales bacterium]
MNISDIAIRRPVFTAMLSIAIIVLGLLSLGRLPTDLYPPVDFPIVLVQTIYPGAPPEDIERDVTRPLEDAVAGIAGVEKLQSFTRDSASLMILQFKMGTDVDAATNQVRDGIGIAKGKLPKDVLDPVIKQVDIGALPVMVVALATSGDVNFTRQVADDRLRPFLEQVPGVGSVNVIGGQKREIQVDLNLDQLAALGLSATSVAERIGYENVSIPVGQFDSHGYAVGVRADGQYRSVKDLGSTVVSMTRDGRQVLLGQIARVVDGRARATRYVRNNLQDAVSLEIVKKSGSNTVEVCHGIALKLAEVVPTLGTGAAYNVIADTSIDIEANAHEVWIAIYYGGAMAVLVILFFLLDWRGTLISSLALPTSIIGTFAAMYLCGFSINTMTLLGMSLAIGLLIDDAVVVRESITRRLEAGDSPAEAASRGTREIALAVLATTLSLVAVFVPVAFMSGMVGQFFKQFGLTITIAVSISLFVAFTLDPMLSARLSVAHVPGPRKGIAGVIERFLDGLDNAYRRTLDWVLIHRKTTVGLSFLAVVLAAGLGLLLPGEFMPKQDRGEVLGDIRLPVGTSLQATDAIARPVEALLLAIPDITRVYATVGHEDQTNRARFRVEIRPKAERQHPLNWYEVEIRKALETVKTAEVTLAEPGVIEGLGDWPPMMLIVQGPDLDGLLVEGTRIKELLEAIPGSSDVRMNISPGKPELRVDVNRMVASDRGIPAGLVGATARLLVEGNTVGTLRDGGPEAEIRVRADPRYSESPERVALLPLPSPRGTVTLGDVANVHMAIGASEINRHNRMRSVTVSSQVADGAALGTVLEAFNARLAEAPLPEGYFLTLDGQARDMNDTAEAMGMAVGVAFIFIFMVLASQFESLIHPFTLLASVPLALVGAVFGLAATGNSISMGSQIGIILLMGLVTKNAILLVDGALVCMREGHSAADAMRIAGPRRMRPILMTSAAMALGMLPTAMGTGMGSEFRSPMGIAVIGGVLSSTLLTLLVVPVVFQWMESVRTGLQRGWRRVSRGPEPSLHLQVAPERDAESGAESGAELERGEADVAK